VQKCIKEIESGRLPEWSNLDAPEIAKDYWRLGKDAKLLDVIYAVRSDESTHRFVNHSLANLKYDRDVNPFAFREPDMHVKGKKLGFERDEADRYVAESKELLQNRENKLH
jgi:ubiquinol oxidase